MLTIIFLYTLVPLVLTVLLTLFTKHRIIGWIAYLNVVVLASLITYFLMPSRNSLSIMWGNAWWSVVWLLITMLFKISDWDSDDDSNTKSHVLFGSSIGITVILVLVSIIGSCHSNMSVKPVWNSIDKTYSRSNEAPTFKKGETPIALAPKTVLNRVRKASSDIPHSQYFSISDDVQAQYYKGKPVYVIPVEYNGFFQMNAAGEIPGYFIIDATKQSASPKFVKKPYVYATSAYFNRDAKRQIYRHTPEWLSLDNPQLEIDDKGNPYWVETIYKSEFMSHRVNYMRLSVAIMNAVTGNVKIYSIHNLPKFVDEGITSGIANQINWDFGKYKYGWWNSHFSKTGVMRPTGNGVENGVTSVFNKNGTISYFTDFTTDRTGSDSALGYSMINARTGKLTFYTASNIMDSDGAKNNADQDYKAQQWHAAMPVLYNVNGHPTWVMNILDQTHAIRGYYYLDATSQNIYGTGSTPTSALEAFRQALVENNAVAGNTRDAHSKTIKGTIGRVAIVSNKAMFTLKGQKTIYTINLNDYSKSALMKPNDKVKFKASIIDGKSVGNVSKWIDYALKDLK